jgi:hypothetical protein
MLGHKSVIIALDLHGDFYADQLDELGDRLREAVVAAAPRCVIREFGACPGLWPVASPVPDA